MTDLVRQMDVMLKHYAAHGTPKQRTLALKALEVPATTRLGRLEQFMRVAGPEFIAGAYRKAFGCEIDGPLASEPQ
jgi:hypothetical protein